MMVESGLDFFYFEIHRAPSEIPANLPGQFSLSGQIFMHWAAATLKRLSEFQNDKIQTTFHHHLYDKNVNFKSQLVLLKIYFQNGEIYDKKSFQHLTASFMEEIKIVAVLEEIHNLTFYRPRQDKHFVLNQLKNSSMFQLLLYMYVFSIPSRLSSNRIQTYFFLIFHYSENIPLLSGVLSHLDTFRLRS